MKANYKQLKAVLLLRIKKFGLFSLASKLDKFLLFDNFFSDLANFWDLDNFLIFDNFPHFSINSSPPSILPISLAASILLASSIYDDTIVFSIDVSSVAILLKS